ncbi:hypothetical protein HYPSUDRAFT_208498 [Hypholoma sublateritium FD-334 SS-4]|uniref:Uncharacterized protein n=1 Tax=Hypholoma sublateritium (strain FD-334 SS-4) TaxID=945553 RepID=A0A0D2LV87_HYPSF|nr:hypothetical protein HYPSUDRAFT_208498 [Hypholoma sublateritium FD-334 SS-4]
MPKSGDDKSGGNSGGGKSNSDTGVIVGAVIGGLALIIIFVFAILILRLRARRIYANAASAQFIKRHPPVTVVPTPPPDARRLSVHKERPRPPRYFPPLSVTSEARSINSFDPPSTLRVPRAGRSPIRDYFAPAISSYGLPGDDIYDSRRSQLTVENLRRYTQLGMTYKNKDAVGASSFSRNAVAKDARTKLDTPILF